MQNSIKIILSTALLLFLSSASAQYVDRSFDLNQTGALQLAEQARLEARKLDKNVSVAVLNSSGVTLLLLKGDDVGRTIRKLLAARHTLRFPPEHRALN